MFIHIIHYLYGLSNIKRDEYLIEKIADKWQDFVILHFFDLRLIKGERQVLEELACFSLNAT